jgi:NAD(P)-dependent dehydrogenase (short-subunit alcohol dehydrogenase family)
MMTQQSQQPGGTAVITGGAGGIGAATARRFAAAGLCVALLDVNREAGEALRQELGRRFLPCL